MAESITKAPPPCAPATLPHTPTSSDTFANIPITEAASLSKTQGTRKRRRSPRPFSPAAPEPAVVAPDSNPSKPALVPVSRAPKSALSPKFTPKLLTGAAALVDEQRSREEKAKVEGPQTTTSPNPARKALGALLGSQSGGMSKLQDAPSAVPSPSGPMAEITPSVKVPPTSENENAMETSPKSAASFRNLDSTPAPTITANGVAVASPRQLDDGGAEDDAATRPNDDGEDIAELDEGRSNKAFTYPGPMSTAQAHRTSSLPQSGHHNLKSHLLTHSHEKPYSCDTCERPHVCPKCDRSFARGDALARHNKGQGGCAGRRSSMGSLGGDEKHEEKMRAGDGDSMPGIMYTGEASHEPENIDEDTDSPGARSLPSIRKHVAPDDNHHQQASEHQSLFQSRQPSTYPPVAARQPTTGGLCPPPNTSPRPVGSGASTAQSSLNQSSYLSGSAASLSFPATTGPNIFAQGSMTESPKPLSPAGMTSHQLGHPDSSIHRNRSPSLTQQFQQQHFGRRTTGHNSPPMSLPPPHPGASHSNAPLLPSLPGLNVPEPRFTLHSQASGPTQLHSSGPNSLQGPSHGPNSPSYPPGNMSSTNNSLSSHSTGPHTSMDRAHSTYPPPNDQLWAFVRNLEVKVDRLQEEVVSLKNQMGGQHHR
ncbi:hypothetical protein MMC28_010960 [Mycoblastus sanguinarius]|nr:hypothetical protein [Mycoblastus sanguinarius]